MTDPEARRVHESGEAFLASLEARDAEARRVDGPVFRRTPLGDVPITFTRHRRGEPQVSRSFGPKKPTHASANLRCIACGDKLVGMSTVLLVLGPGSNPDEFTRHHEGRWYNATAVEIHEACSTAQGFPVPQSNAQNRAVQNRLLVLRKIEWVGPKFPDDPNPTCVLCGNRRPLGHRPDCDLGLALQDAVPARAVDPDTNRCPDCEGEPVYDEVTHHLVCEACGQLLQEAPLKGNP